MIDLKNHQQALTWQQVRFDRDLDPSDVARLVLGLISDRSLGDVVLETEATPSGAVYRVGSARPAMVRTMFASLLQTAIIEPDERSLPSTGRAWEVRVNTNRRSIATGDHEGASRRLLAMLTHNLGGLAVHQVVIGPRLQPMAVRSSKPQLHPESWQDFVGQLVFGNRQADPELRKAMADKQSQPGAYVSIRILGADAESAETTARGYLAVLRSLEAPGLRFRLRPVRWSTASEARPGHRKLPLNTTELAIFTGWPHGSTSYPGIDRNGPRTLPPIVSSGADRLIGTSTYPGRTTEIGVSAKDALHHMHVLGPTGVGKSTLLMNLALQDIKAGRGVVVVDPKGDLVDDILARVPSEHTERLVVLDPARKDRLVGFNPLATRHEDDELAVDGILSAIRGLNQDSWGPRTQDILHAALLTLVGSELNSICYLPQLLSDAPLRRRLLESVDLPPAVMSFWRWFESLSDAERANVIAPAMNKLRPFTMRSALRGVLGQRQPDFDPLTIFTERKVLLVSLRKGLIGQEAANLLGSLLLARLWQLTMTRSGIPQAKRHPVFFYLDEFQDYLRLQTDLTDVLAQSRGLGVGLTLAHQHLAQLNPSTKSAVLANARNRVDFQLSAEDAAIIARSNEALEAQDFIRLPAFHVYARLMHQSQVLPTVSIHTSPATSSVRKPSQLAKKIARQWGQPLDVIDTELLEASKNPANTSSAIGKRKRGAA